jgi:TRAP-type C4-dicarboxylate transport system substrate-binding protein
MAYFDPNWFSQSIPFMSMFAAPYIFEDYDHMAATFSAVSWGSRHLRPT